MAGPLGPLLAGRLCLGKNLRLKFRSWLGTAMELLLPVALMGLMIWIRVEVKTENLPAMSYLKDVANNPTYIPSQLLVAEPALAQELQYYTGMNVDGFMQLHLQEERQRLGVVGHDGEPLADFLASLPGYEDLVHPVFPDRSAFEAYIGDPEYGFVAGKPQLFAAVEVRRQGDSFDFVFHLNATGPGVFPADATTVSTRAPAWNPLQKGLDMSSTQRYWSGAGYASDGEFVMSGGLVDLQALAYAWAGNATGAWELPAGKALPACTCKDPATGQETQDLARCPNATVQLLTPVALGGCSGRLSGLFPVTWREVPFPTEAYTQDGFAAAVEAVFGFFFVLVFEWPLTRIMKSIVEDKERRLNEVMKMMGMPGSAIDIGWYLSFSLLWLLPSALIPLVCTTTVFKHSNDFVVFLFFWLFGVEVIAFCSFCAVFFEKAKTASVAVALLFFILYFPYVLLQGTARSLKLLGCVAPPTALSFGAALLAQLETSGDGAQWGNLHEDVDGLSMADVLLAMALGIPAFVVMTWYCGQVYVAGVGTARPWYFVCQPDTWPCFSGRRGRVELSEQAEAGDPEDAAGGVGSGPLFEAVGAEWADRLTVRARSLRKAFPAASAPGGYFNAVDGVSFNLYEGQIFCLLGHNGAGKTTTIGVLSGLTPATDGDAVIYGHSVRRAMKEIRQILGVCPQHDVVWDALSVNEHLRFFARLKGVDRSAVTQAAEAATAAVGLEPKAHSPAATLSGGQKRRLSMAIAMIGGSRVVFLDEPTSGVDPSSRREMWNYLRAERATRTIILTTHFMDEAEILGDRIAIMSAGRLRCCGSALFLKRQYGVGYTLTITRSQAARGRDSQGTSRRAREMVLGALEGAEVLNDVGGELSFRAPFGAARGMPQVLRNLEQQPDTYGVEAFAVSVTTLEEVFIRVGTGDHAGDQTGAAAAQERSSSFQAARLARQVSEERRDVNGAVVDSTGGSASRAPFLPDDPRAPEPAARSVFLRHVHALLVKRFRNSMRDRKAWCWELALPMVFLLLALVTLKFSGVGSYPADSLALDALPSPQQLPFGAAPGQEAAAAGLMADAASGVPGLTVPAANASTAVAFDDWLSGGYGGHEAAHRFGALRWVDVPAPGAVRTFDQQIKTPVGDLTLSCEMAPPERPGVASVTVKDAAGGVIVPAFQLAVPVGTPRGATIEVPVFGVQVPVPLGLLNNRLQVDVFWNSTARNAVPAMHSDVMLRALRRHSPALELRSSVQPYPLTASQKSYTDTQTSLFLSLGFAFIPASYCAFVVRERENGAKHLQVISGVHMVAYWLATWIWDLLNFLVPALLSVLLIAAFRVESLMGYPNWPWAVLCILLYGLSVTPFTYMLSFLFKSHTAAQNMILISYLLTGGILEIVNVVLVLLPSTQDLEKNVLIYIFRLIPNFSLADSLSNLIIRETPAIFGGETKEPWDLEITGYDTIFMSCTAVAFFGLTLLLELMASNAHVRELLNGRCRWRRRAAAPDAAAGPWSRQRSAEDPDVAQERQRVADGAADDEMILLHEFTKVYPTPGGGHKRAVDAVSFGIPAGECFGYLGVNGAGKTTTMKMLTGAELPTSGWARLGGFDVVAQQRQVRQLIGYCPQFDALIGKLTAREHLVLFARIKNYPEAAIPEYVTGLLEKLTLTQYADRPAETYSGGNRRKLSLGIALVGNPAVVFLDEPTTGVDPVSRRFMWSLIAETMAGRSVILTTHSMDECEALCSRIGIMAGGRLRCLGSGAELKARHGSGYFLNIAFNPTADLAAAGAALVDFLRAEFGDAARADEDAQVDARAGEAGAVAAPLQLERHSAWQIPRTRPLSEVFKALEAARGRLQVEEYSASEATLEQIFLRFANAGQ